MIDLLDPDQDRPQPVAPEILAVVSDASLANSGTIASLRRHVAPFRSAGVPFVCILQEDTPRSRAQAQALGTTHILRADEIAQVAVALNLAPAPRMAPGGLTADVQGADASLTRMLALGRAGGPIAPELIEVGAAYIESALRQGDIRAWLEEVWRFDDITHQHCLLVAGLAAGFAQQLGLGQADCQRLTRAALLHDIGKSRIPLAILNKPGKLTVEERREIETHPVIGYDLLVGQGHAAETLAVVRSHHEYLDGTGYPDGLHGAGIPDLVRLVTICDIYGALLERRPYKAPMSPERAMGILEDMGGKLDRDLLRAFRPISLPAARPHRIRA